MHSPGPLLKLSGMMVKKMNLVDFDFEIAASCGV